MWYLVVSWATVLIHLRKFPFFVHKYSFFPSRTSKRNTILNRSVSFHNYPKRVRLYYLVPGTLATFLFNSDLYPLEDYILDAGFGFRDTLFTLRVFSKWLATVEHQWSKTCVGKSYVLQLFLICYWYENQREKSPNEIFV